MSVRTASRTSEQLRAKRAFGVGINFSRTHNFVRVGHDRPLCVFYPCTRKVAKRRWEALGRTRWCTERQQRIAGGREWRQNCSSGISGRFSAQTWPACQMMSGKEKQKESVPSLGTWKFTPLTYLAWIGLLPLCSRSNTALSHMSETDDESKQGLC